MKKNYLNLIEQYLIGNRNNNNLLILMDELSVQDVEALIFIISKEDMICWPNDYKKIENNSKILFPEDYSKKKNVINLLNYTRKTFLINEALNGLNQLVQFINTFSNKKQSINTSIDNDNIRINVSNFTIPYNRVVIKSIYSICNVSKKDDFIFLILKPLADICEELYRELREMRSKIPLEEQKAILPHKKEELSQKFIELIMILKSYDIESKKNEYINEIKELNSDIESIRSEIKELNSDIESIRSDKEISDDLLHFLIKCGVYSNIEKKDFDEIIDKYCNQQIAGYKLIQKKLLERYTTCLSCTGLISQITSVTNYLVSMIASAPDLSWLTTFVESIISKIPECAPLIRTVLLDKRFNLPTSDIVALMYNIKIDNYPYDILSLLSALASDRKDIAQLIAPTICEPIFLNNSLPLEKLLDNVMIEYILNRFKIKTNINFNPVIQNTIDDLHNYYKENPNIAFSKLIAKIYENFNNRIENMQSIITELENDNNNNKEIINKKDMEIHNITNTVLLLRSQVDNMSSQQSDNALLPLRTGLINISDKIDKIIDNLNDNPLAVDQYSVILLENLELLEIINVKHGNSPGNSPEKHLIDAGIYECLSNKTEKIARRAFYIDDPYGSITAVRHGWTI
jgi:hypothetical protein